MDVYVADGAPGVVFRPPCTPTNTVVLATPSSPVALGRLSVRRIKSRLATVGRPEWDGRVGAIDLTATAINGRTQTGILKKRSFPTNTFTVLSQSFSLVRGLLGVWSCHLTVDSFLVCGVVTYLLARYVVLFSVRFI